MKRSDKRSAARLAASQALYQMEIADKGLNDILAEFEAHWIGQEIEGDSTAGRPGVLSRRRLRRAGRPIARSIAASTTRSPKAGRCGGSKRSCAPSCARRFTSCETARTCRRGSR